MLWSQDSFVTYGPGTCRALQIQVVLYYRNQSIDLLYKSIDWFLYEGTICILMVGLNVKHAIHVLEHFRLKFFKKALRLH